MRGAFGFLWHPPRPGARLLGFGAFLSQPERGERFTVHRQRWGGGLVIGGTADGGARKVSCSWRQASSLGGRITIEVDSGVDYLISRGEISCAPAR